MTCHKPTIICAPPGLLEAAARAERLAAKQPKNDRERELDEIIDAVDAGYMTLTEGRERLDASENERIESARAIFAGLVGAIVVLIILFACAMFGWQKTLDGAEPPRIPKAAIKWLLYKPAGSVDGQGILRDVTSRCDARTRQEMYSSDSETFAHECTHGLNSIIRNSFWGPGGSSKDKDGNYVNAFYVGDGKCVVLREPRLRISQVRQYVRTSHPTPSLTLSSWETRPLYLCDELSAYINGFQHTKETGRQSHGSGDRAEAMCDWCDGLIVAIERHDPKYAHLAELREYVAFQRKRLAELRK